MKDREKWKKNNMKKNMEEKNTLPIKGRESHCFSLFAGNNYLPITGKVTIYYVNYYAFNLYYREL